MQNLNPYDVLKKQVGKKIKVYLNDGSCYKGMLLEVGNEDKYDLLIKNFDKLYLIKGKEIYLIQLMD